MLIRDLNPSDAKRTWEKARKVTSGPNGHPFTDNPDWVLVRKDDLEALRVEVDVARWEDVEVPPL